MKSYVSYNFISGSDRILKRPIKVGISEIKWSTLKQEQGNIKYKFLESVSKFGQGAGVFCFWKVGILELQSCGAAKGAKILSSGQLFNP
jgi:hypothetical protein